MRRLTIFCLAIFCLAVCLSRSTVLLAQTNNSSGLFGNRTTGGANQGTKASAGASGNRSTGGANPAPSGNIGSGTPGNSGGNFRSPGETGLGQTGSAAARRARLEASSAGGNKGQAQGGLTGGYIAPAGSYFVGAAQADGINPASPQPGYFGGSIGGKPITAGQSFAPGGVQGGLPGKYDLSTAASNRTAPRGTDPADGRSSQVSAEIARHLQGMPALHFLTPLQVNLDGGTAILGALWQRTTIAIWRGAWFCWRPRSTMW